MNPPFRLIASMLLAGALIAFLLLPFSFFTGPEPVPLCGGIIPPPEPVCGNWAMENPQDLDSLGYAKYDRGENLFKTAGCISCHDIHKKKVGPPLRGIMNRRERPWVRQAIIDFNVLVNKKDSTALAVYNEYNQMARPTHEFLNEEEIGALIFYLEKHP